MNGMDRGWDYDKLASRKLTKGTKMKAQVYIEDGIVWVEINGQAMTAEAWEVDGPASKEVEALIEAARESLE